MISSNKGKKLHSLLKEIFYLHSCLTGIRDLVHEQTGLSTPKRKIMQIIDNKEMTVPDIAYETGTSRQFVQTVCNDLAGNNLIEFRTNPRHKRSKKVILTEEGKNLLLKSRKKENSYIEKALPEIEGEDAVLATDVLRKIRHKLSDL